METHVKHLGSLFIIFGAFLGILFGSLFLVVAINKQPVADEATPILSSVSVEDAAILAAGIGVCALPGIIIGCGLLKFRRWARTLGIIFSVLCLPVFPFGTALGVYGLWTLRNKDSLPLFGRAQPVS